MPAALSDAALQVSAERTSFFHREGYLTLDALTTPDELAWLREVYDRLFREQVGRKEGAHLDLAGTDEDGQQAALPQIMNPARFVPELEHTQYRKNALAVARQLFGPSARYRGEHMIYKPPHHGAATPWHQDQAYHHPGFVYRQVNVWMPLQEATVENGCMQYVPRSHAGFGVLPHHHIGHDPRIHGLEVDAPERCFERAVACPVPAGGAALHHSYLLHYAGPNRSPIPRRAYILTFALEPEPRAVPLELPWQQESKTARQQREKAFREQAESKA